VTHRSWAGRIGLLLFVVAAALVAQQLLFSMVYTPVFEGDTDALIRGSSAALGCLRAGTFVSCPGVIHFPLLGYLPAVAGLSLGLGRDELMRMYEIFNALSLVAIGLLGYQHLRSRVSASAAFLFVLAIVTSPFLTYSRGTFGEPLAAFLTLLFAWACLERKSPLVIFVLFVLAGMTKEVAAPFLLLTGLAAWNPLDKPQAFRKAAMALVAAAVVGFALASAFNLFRFGTYWNVSNWAYDFHVHSLSQSARFFAGLWLSPNGGILFFWPLSALIVAATACRSWTWGLSALTLAGLTAGLSRWYSPFGWFAWGPRLLLPWIPAILLVLLHHLSPLFFARLGRGKARLPGRAVLLVTAVWVAASAANNLTESSDWIELARFFQRNPDCPELAFIENGAEPYYRCLDAQVWPHQLFLSWNVLRRGLSQPQLPYTIAFWVVLGGLLVQITRTAQVGFLGENE
jgi:hypothetical protein